MKSWQRIKGLAMRQLYLYPRSIPRIMDVFFWPVLSLLLWGFLSKYLQQVNLTNVNIVSVLLGAVIFWEFISRAQNAVSIVFLEEIWERNLLNIFVTPLNNTSWICANCKCRSCRLSYRLFSL